MEIANYTVYSDNPYHALIYSTERYTPVKMEIDPAIEKLEKAKKGIFHIHWEEHLLRKSLSEAEASSQVSYFLERLGVYKKRGGKVVLTIHNAQPHELNYLAQFDRMRSTVLQLADRVLVHNLETIALLQQKFDIGLHKIFYLPHPSYLGVYEAVDATRKRLSNLSLSNDFLLFGKIRRYKSVDKLLDIWPADDENLKLLIAGDGIPEDDYVEVVADMAEALPNVRFDRRRIENEEMPGLLSQAKALIMPNEDFLTSGALLAAISFGLPVIAAAKSGVMEVLPTANHRFLFEPGNFQDCLDKIRSFSALTDEEVLELHQLAFERAGDYSASKISGIMAGLFDSLLSS